MASFQDPIYFILPALLLIGCHGARPANLGIHDNRLAACPSTPNCVSSRAADKVNSIDPLPLIGSGKGAIERLRNIVAALPRTEIIARTDGYLYAECTSLIFRFVDDLEFLVDDKANVIEVRSASRLGTSDMGVNRKRIERIRALWMKSNDGSTERK